MAPEIEEELARLRKRIDDVNRQLLRLFNERAALVQRVGDLKKRSGQDLFSPMRERQMLDALVAMNEGPFSDETIRHLFKEIFRASLGLMEGELERELLVARRQGQPRTVVRVGYQTVGERPVVIAGPCAVESREQLEQTAEVLTRLGIKFMRGGAFKPRTSPYSFQGLGEKGLRLLGDVAKRFGLLVVTEVLDTRTVDLVARHADVLQIGARNMANYELLKEAARTRRPILLKRGFAATLDEFVRAAEYIALEGNDQIILCERGIRTFARETRFTLDVGAIPLLQQMTRLPVVADVSHASGRRDLVLPLAKACLAAGAHGIMVETHPVPELACSDSQQQLDLDQLADLVRDIGPLLAP